MHDPTTLEAALDETLQVAGLRYELPKSGGDKVAIDQRATREWKEEKPEAKGFAWLFDPRIVGFGIDLRTDAPRPFGSEWVLHLLLSDEAAAIELPDKVELLGTDGTVDVETSYVGTIKAHIACLDKVYSPAPGGVTISADGLAPGTLGCIAVDSAGDRFILSCCHVLGWPFEYSDGRIYQPSSTKRPTDVAMLERFGHLYPFSIWGFSTSFDAAIARIHDPSMIDPQIFLPSTGGRFMPLSEPPSLTPTNVVKAGACTHYTQGRLKRTRAVNIKVEYPLPNGSSVFIGFKDQWCGDYASDFGDSGALVMDLWHRPVGLHFASSTTGESYFSPIRPILDALEVSIVGKVLA